MYIKEENKNFPLGLEVQVGVMNQSTNELPSYKTIGSSGVDIRAYINEPITIGPMERVLIPTGIYLEIPLGFEGQLRPRSGLSIKHGITLVNCVGTIDSDYRGEVKVPIINLSNDTYIIENGDRIAQLILAMCEHISWIEQKDVIATERGTGGFGSTGIK